MNEAVSEAAARLERAVGRLAEVAARPRPAAEPAPAGVPLEQVTALAQRLDVSLAKLRGVLAELDAPEAEATQPEAGELSAEPVAVEEDGLPSRAQPPAAHPEEER